MGTQRRCQACGAPEGAPRVTYKTQRSYGVASRVKHTGAIVRLTEVVFADYGQRLACADCAKAILERVHRLRASKQVAYRTPHEVGGRQSHERRKEALDPGNAPHALAEFAVSETRHRRTGIPASRMRAFASPTVCCP